MKHTLKSLSAKLTIALVLLATAGIENEARADLSLSAVGALNFAKQSLSPDLTNGQTLALGTTLGFGGLLSTSFIPGFAIELGVLYIPRKGSINDVNGNNLLSFTTKNLQIPLLLRFTALPFLSVGAGPYYSHTIGALTLSLPNQLDQSYDFSSTQGAGYSQSDFGLEGSAAISFPILPLFSVMADLRYVFGLTNLDGSGITTQHTRDLQLLAGLTFSL